MRVYPGEVVGIVGQNGAGKATRTKLLNGLPAANGGTSTASNSTSGRYEGADVTCTLNSDANLRSGPATSYEVLTAVPAGFTVTVHSYANGWSCVTWGDTTGYISNSLINGLPTANGGKGGSSSGSTAQRLPAALCELWHGGGPPGPRQL